MTIETTAAGPTTHALHPGALHPGGPPATQEPDRIPLARIIAIFVVAVVTIAVSIVVVVVVERHPTTQWPTKPSPPVLFGVQQNPIAGPASGSALRAEQKRALATYAVVDRGAGVVSIPIELAKRLVVARAAQAAPATMNERGGAR